MLRIRVKIDADRTTKEFKDASRDIRKRAKTGLAKAAKRVVLPAIRRFAPGVVDSFLTVKATSTRAFITTEGPKIGDRITGLLNFGGTVTTKVEPKRKLAVALRGTDVVVAAVTKPRKYTGKHFIEKGVAQTRDKVQREALPEIMKAFDGLEHRP